MEIIYFNFKILSINFVNEILNDFSWLKMLKYYQNYLNIEMELPFVVFNDIIKYKILTIFPFNKFDEFRMNISFNRINFD